MAELGTTYELEGATGFNGEPIDIASFNDEQDPNFIGYLDDISGLDGADVRQAAQERSRQHGGIHGDFLLGRRTIVMAGRIWPIPVSTRHIREDKLLAAARALSSDAYLRWTPADGIEREVAVRMADRPSIRGGYVKDFSIALVAADPRIYSRQVNTRRVSYMVNPAMTMNVPNAGNIEAPCTVRIYGPINDPIIGHQQRGQELTFNGLSLAADDYLEVDLNARTATVNGVDNVYSSLLFPASWWALDPRDNTIYVQGSGGQTDDTRAVITYRHAWA